MAHTTLSRSGRHLAGLALAFVTAASGCSCNNSKVRGGDCSPACPDRYVCVTANGSPTCEKVARECKVDSDCCPGQKCHAAGDKAICQDKYTHCTADSTCTAAGQLCKDTGKFPEANGCSFNTCDDAHPCGAGTSCVNGYCAGEAPCQGGCSTGKVCVVADNFCFPLDSDSNKWPMGCAQTCPDGSFLALRNPYNVYDDCDMTQRQCTCATLPPLQLNDVSRYSSLAVGDTQLWVSAYNGAPYGDLVVHQVDKSTGAIKATEFVDGVPATGRIVADPSGPRHGIADPGDDVGEYTDVAVDSGGNVLVSYYDVTNGDLKFAIRGSGGTWTAYTLDGNGKTGPDTGLYTSLALTSTGVPAIAYFQKASANGGYHTALRYIRARKAAPTAVTDWFPAVEVDGQDRDPPPCGGPCSDPSTQVCVTVPSTGDACEPLAAADACAVPGRPACPNNTACVTVNTMPVCLPSKKASALQSLPPGVGLMASLAFMDDRAVIAYYADIGSKGHGTAVGPDTLRLAVDGSTSAGQPAFAVNVLEGGDGKVRAGQWPSVAIGANAPRVNVAYQELGRWRLKLYQGDGVTPAGSDNTAVVDEGFADPQGDAKSFVGANASLVVGASGNLAVAYQNQTGSDLFYSKPGATAGSWGPAQVVRREGAVGFYAKLRTQGTQAWISHSQIRAKSASEAANQLYVEPVAAP